MKLIQVCIVAILLSVWEFYSYLIPSGSFYFSAPSQILKTFYRIMLDGTLVRDVIVTTFESVFGFCVGTILGTATGIAFWFSKLARQVAYPFVVAIGAIPIFAVSPLIIIWLGIGLVSKVALAALASYFTATYQAYQGISSVDMRLYNMLIVFGAAKPIAFRKCVVPGGIYTVIDGARINIGFAFAGAFIGEVISSEIGLGHATMVAMGLFDMTRVIIGVMCFAGLALFANFLVDKYGPKFAHSIILRL